MISIEEARRLIGEQLKPDPKTERIPLDQALGRVLVEAVFTDSDFPSFDKSAMDGYAIKSDEISLNLLVDEFIPAGKKPLKKIKAGHCAQIMTGAMVPEGADMVVMQEHVEFVGENTIKITNHKSRKNILYRGEDLKKGELLLAENIRLSPAHLGLLASVGATKPLVYSQTTVTIISTGDELVAPDVTPVPPQIRNSNSSQLKAMTALAGGKVVFTGKANDDPEEIYAKVQHALSLSNIVILTGGASVGELDFTGQVFKKLGATLLFDKLAIQPGKPVIFATVGNKILFGLSGNPVSSFVQFKLFVEPTIHQMMGLRQEERILKLPLSSNKTRKKAERMLFFPVVINDKMEAESVEYHGSGHLHAYHNANAMAAFPIGMNELKKGTLVDVRPF